MTETAKPAPAQPAPTQPAPTRAATTVMLLRDRPHGMEVFMVVRHHQIDFASGALVFPGGSVDKADRDARVRARCAGVDGLDEEGLALRVAGIREAFEECGVLLARRRGEAGLITAADLLAIEAKYRKPLTDGELGIADLCEAEDLTLACDALAHFAHWITPAHMPKRFDTHFFLATAPDDQIAVHDGHESVDSVWLRPEDACAAADENRYTIIFPTRVNIEKLGRARTVADAFVRAAAEPVVTVLPNVERTPAGRIMRIPEAAGYGFTEVHLEGPSGSHARRLRPQDVDKGMNHGTGASN